MSNQGSVNPTRLSRRFEKFELPDKLRAIEQLAKLCGWNEPEKFEHGANDELTEVLKRLRGGSPG